MKAKFHFFLVAIIAVIITSFGMNCCFAQSRDSMNVTIPFDSLTIDNIKLSQSGVYSCSKGNTDCNTSLVDTILIDVKLKQETPPCTPAANVVTCSNIPSVTFSSVTKGFGGNIQYYLPEYFRPDRIPEFYSII